MLRRFVLVAIIATTLTSCPSEDNKGSLRVSETALEFSGSGGSAIVDIASNVEWDAASDQQWCALSPKLGIGSATLNVTAQRNTTTEPRTATLTVQSTDGDLKREIAVTQKAGQSEEPVTDPDGHSLNITPLELDFAQGGGNKTAQVTANVNWTTTSKKYRTDNHVTKPTTQMYKILM